PKMERGNGYIRCHYYSRPPIRRPGRPQGAQGPPAGDVVVRRLCRDRHHSTDRRRGAVRGARRPLGTEGARRRRRQRQCLPRSAPPAGARGWGNVVAPYYVPALLERARERAPAERLEIEFREADAEALPFPDSAFDVVLSTFGVMFTPDQERAAAEMLRVCKP